MGAGAQRPVPSKLNWHWQKLDAQFELLQQVAPKVRPVTKGFAHDVPQFPTVAPKTLQLLSVVDV